MVQATTEKKVNKLLSLTISLLLLCVSQAHAGINFFGSDKEEPEQTATTSNFSGPVSYADAVAKAAPAVVSIQATKEVPNEIHPMMRDPFFRFFFDPYNQGLEMPEQDQMQLGLGSGVIVDKRGYVLTNNHVIRDADKVNIKLHDGRTSEAKVVGSDPQTDLAVLKIDLKDVPAIELGTSAKSRVGDVALAIGNPFGLERTVTQGIISATGNLSERSTEEMGVAAPGKGYLDNLIQTDASINPGNSGGALIDAYGKLIGINMFIVTRSGGSQGIGFAIPVDTAKDIMTQLIETGEIIRGFLGTTLAPITEELRQYLEYKESNGVYVSATLRNSPAQRAGILPGDVITKINKTKVKDQNHAVRLVGQLKPNEAYPVEVYRKGQFMNFSVLIAKRPDEHPKRQSK